MILYINAIAVISTLATKSRADSFCRSKSTAICKAAAVLPEPGAPPTMIIRPGLKSSESNGGPTLNLTGGSPRCKSANQEPIRLAAVVNFAGVVILNPLRLCVFQVPERRMESRLPRVPAVRIRFELPSVPGPFLAHLLANDRTRAA